MDESKYVSRERYEKEERDVSSKLEKFRERIFRLERILQENNLDCPKVAPLSEVKLPLLGYWHKGSLDIRDADKYQLATVTLNPYNLDTHEISKAIIKLLNIKILNERLEEN